jgi:hypothetical protein
VDFREGNARWNASTTSSPTRPSTRGVPGCGQAQPRAVPRAAAPRRARGLRHRVGQHAVARDRGGCPRTRPCRTATGSSSRRLSGTSMPASPRRGVPAHHLPPTGVTAVGINNHVSVDRMVRVTVGGSGGLGLEACEKIFVVGCKLMCM